MSVRLADVIAVLDAATHRAWRRAGTRSAWSAVIPTIPSTRSRWPSTPPPRWWRRWPSGACCWPTIRCCCAGWTRSPPARRRGADPPPDPPIGGAVHRAHQRRLRQPGVSDALAEVLGPDRGGGARAGRRRSAGGQVGDLRAPESAQAVRSAVFEAGAGHIGDYSQCSWSITGIGQFRPDDGATPTVGTVGTLEQVPEDRVEVVAPARLRGPVLAAMRAAHPMRSRLSTCCPRSRCPTGRSRPHRQPAAATALRGLRSVREFRSAADHLGHPRGR